MQWKGNVQESCRRPGEVGTRNNEVTEEDGGSPDEPQSVSTSPSESEASPKCGKASESPDIARMRKEEAEGKRKGKGAKGKERG